MQRITIKGAPHIITDYIYEGEPLHINLDSLNNAKTNKRVEIPAIVIDYSPVSLQNVNNKIILESEIKHDIDSTDINIILNINNEETTKVKIDEETFVNDIIATCLENKKDIKNMPCYNDAINNAIDIIKANALDSDMLIKEDVLNYKCYIYSNDMELLGTANRLILSTNNDYILGEYVGKKLTELQGQSIVIDMCINNDIVLQFANFMVGESIDSSLSYVKLFNQNVMVKRLMVVYDNIEFNIPAKFNIPEFYKTWTIHDYYEKLLLTNSPDNIEKVFKQNKQNKVCNININKYLIW